MGENLSFFLFHFLASCSIGERSSGSFPAESGVRSLPIFLWWRDIGLDMTAVEIFVSLGPDVLDDVGDSQHELVLYGRHPGVVVQLQDGPGAQEVQVAETGWKDGQSVTLEVEFSQAGELSNLLGNIHQVIVSDSQDPQVLQVLDVRTQMLKLIVTEVQ